MQKLKEWQAQLNKRLQRCKEVGICLLLVAGLLLVFVILLILAVVESVGNFFLEPFGRKIDFGLDFGEMEEGYY